MGRIDCHVSEPPAAWSRLASWKRGRSTAATTSTGSLDFPAECVDLIYLDPPFFSNRNYEVIWGDEAEVRSFEDRWEGGIQLHRLDGSASSRCIAS